MDQTRPSTPRGIEPGDGQGLPPVLVTRRIPAAGLAALEGRVRYEVLAPCLPPPPETLLVALRQGWQGVLSTLTEKLDAAAFDACPGLVVVANMAVGYDNIDVKAATERGILITNTPGVLTETTADLTWALLMAAARRLGEAERHLRAGLWRTWEPEGLLGQDVCGATLGLVGLGRIGQAVARRARGFDMRVLYCEPEPRPEAAQAVGAEYRELDGLLREADFVTVHVPLTRTTYHLFSESEFRRMKPTAVFVNTSRGQVVDQEALARAIRERWIFAAALDVFEREPLDPADPLLGLDNLVLVPHIGSASVATRNRMATLAAENLLAALDGRRPPCLVNEAAWGRRHAPPSPLV